MATLELSLQRKVESGWPIVANLTDTGDFLPVRREGTLTLNLEALRGLEFQPPDYGEMLGKALFVEDIRDTFKEALAGSKPLRVLLSVEDDDLRRLDWHRLTAPISGKWPFLAVQQNTHFSLAVHSPANARFPAIGRRDLRALIVVAGIESLSGTYPFEHFDTEATIKSAQEALCDIPSDVLDPPTLDELCARLTATPYTLLHLVCHGALMKNGETILYFPKEVNGGPVTATELINRLANIKNLPHFAFLSTCESANPKAESGLGSLAQRLVRELGMPSIVAMTDKVTIKTAQAIAAPFYAQLYTHGEPDRALAESLARVLGHVDITVPALLSRLGGRALFSDSLERELTRKEIEAGLDAMAALLLERAPLQLPKFEKLAHQARATLAAETAALSEAARAERRAALEALNLLGLECLDLAFNALCLGQQPPAYDARSPFRGLESFRPEDKDFFFGRDTLTRRLVQRIREHPFLAVLGASGSGKSSLVMAGLVPNLGGEYAIFKPGAEPLRALETALPAAGKNGLLVVDQFEELFTLAHDDAARRAFIDRLLGETTRRKVVVTMRADFIGEVAAYRALKEQVQAHQELVAPMDSAEMRRAMDEQAASVGLRFESDLSQQILDDVAAEPGAMPLLQHALWLLWQRRHGRWLRADEYRDFGGVRRAIASTADEVYAACSEGEKARMQDIFLRLTRLDDDSAGGEHRDTRRRVLLRDLVPSKGDSKATLDLVDRLANARLVVKSTPKGQENADNAAQKTEVEVAHEALIRHWDKLRGWLTDDRDNLRLREGVSDDSRRWDNAARDENLLNHRGARLDLALEMSAKPRYQLNPVEQAYLDACQALREREKTAAARRRRIAIAGVSAALVVIMMLLAGWAVTSGQNAQKLAIESTKVENARVTAVFNEQAALNNEKVAQSAQATAVFNEQEAKSARDRAEQQTFIARVGELAAQTVALRGKLPVVSLLMGIETYRKLATPRTHAVLLDNITLHPQVQQYLSGHSGAVNTIAFSPDGKLLASGSADGTIILWDVATRQPVGQPIPNHHEYTAVAFSPDGKLLVSGDGQYRLVLYEVPSGRMVGEPLVGHSQPIRHAVFSPDGKLLASGAYDNTIIIWDVATRKPVGEPLRGHTAGVYSVAFSPDGKLLASSSIDRTIILWDTATFKPIGEPLVGHRDSVTNVVFSPDGKMLASASIDTHILLWDLATRQPSEPLSGHTSTVRTISFNKDGSLLASASYDGTVVVWDVQARKPLGQRLTGHSDRVRSAAFSPDGRLLASGSDDSTVVLWEASAYLPVSTLHAGLNKYFAGLAASPDGSLLALPGDSGTVLIWDAAAGRLSDPPLRGHTDKVFSAAFSPDGKTLATAGVDRSILLWDMQSRIRVGTPLKGHTESVLGLAFSPDGKRLVSASVDHTLIVWDVETAQPVFTLKGHTAQVSSVVFSPDGKTIVSGGYDSAVIFWDAATGKMLGEPQRAHLNGVNALAFSPDGALLASVSSDSTVILWDAAARRVSGEPLRAHTDAIYSLAFSPDGKTLATGSLDKTLILWDLSTRQPSAEPLKGPAGTMLGLAFSPNGLALQAATQTGDLVTWNLDPQFWIERSCQRAGRNFTLVEWAQYFPGEEFRATCPQWPQPTR